MDEADANRHTPPSPGGRKRIGGRPAKPESERLKNVPLRMTDAERRQAEDQARAAGLTLSAYLRARVLGKTVRGVVPAVNRAAYAELARTTANINQIAAHMNAGGDAPAGLRDLLEEAAREVRILRLQLLGIQEGEE